MLLDFGLLLLDFFLNFPKAPAHFWNFEKIYYVRVLRSQRYEICFKLVQDQSFTDLLKFPNFRNFETKTFHTILYLRILLEPSRFGLKQFGNILILIYNMRVFQPQQCVIYFKNVQDVRCLRLCQLFTQLCLQQ